MKDYHVRIEMRAYLNPKEPMLTVSERIRHHHLQTRLDYLVDKLKDVCEQMIEYSLEISTLNQEGKV